MGFHVPLLPEEKHEILAVLAPEKICFPVLFLTRLRIRTLVHFSDALYISTQQLFGSTPYFGRKLLRTFNPGFWFFFLKIGCCPLYDLNFHVLRMRNRSLHKNPRVGSLRGSFGPQWNFERALELFH